MNNLPPVNSNPKPTNWRTFACFFLGVLGVGMLCLAWLVPTTIWFQDLIPWAVLFTFLAWILLASAVFLYRKNFSLKVTLIFFLGASTFPGFAWLRVRNHVSPHDINIFFKELPPQKIQAEFNRNFSKENLEKLFKPALMEAGHSFDFGIATMKPKWTQCAPESSSPDKVPHVFRLQCSFYDAMHPNAIEPLHLINQYGKLKLEFMIIAQIRKRIKTMTERIKTMTERYFPASKNLMSDYERFAAIRRITAIKKFHKSVKQSFRAPDAFIRCLAERDTDPKLRESARKLLKSINATKTSK